MDDDILPERQLVPRHLAILILIGAAPFGCKTRRLPALPTERDPSAEQAPIVPYRAPPDVLTTELSTGAPTSGKTGHEGHDMGGMKNGTGDTKQEDIPKPGPTTGHEGHDMGGAPETKEDPK